MRRRVPQQGGRHCQAAKRGYAINDDDADPNLDSKPRRRQHHQAAMRKGAPLPSRSTAPIPATATS